MLQQFRQDDSVYQQILSSAVEVNSGEILMPRLSGRQQHRNNVPATSAEEYFKLAVFLPFIDTVTVQLDERFRHHSSVASRLSGLLPSVCANRKIEAVEG